jgi:signal peptidase I
MIGIFKIHGESMHPALSSGDFVVAARFYRQLAMGDLIVFQHPVYGRLIKRIKQLDPVGNILVQSENKQGLSSEQMGWLEPNQIYAKVLFSSRKKQFSLL